MKLHLLLPGLLAVLFLSGCVVEETYSGHRYHDRGPAYGYRDTVYVEGRSSPRYRDSYYSDRGYDRGYHRDYDRSDYRSRDYNHSYSRSYDDRSRSDYSRSGNSGRSYNGSRSSQRSVKDPASEYYKQQRSKSVKTQQKSKEKEKRNND